MKILISPFEKNRKHITDLLNKRQLNGIGIEIGVNKGIFSKVLLDSWNCEKLFLVDKWHDYAQYDEKEHKHNENYQECLRNIENVIRRSC